MAGNRRRGTNARERTVRQRERLSRFIFYYYYYSSKNSRSLIRLTILLYSYKNVCACDLCVYETACVCENVRDCACVCLLTEVYRASITKKRYLQRNRSHLSPVTDQENKTKKERAEEEEEGRIIREQ